MAQWDLRSLPTLIFHGSLTHHGNYRQNTCVHVIHRSHGENAQILTKIRTSQAGFFSPGSVQTCQDLGEGFNASVLVIHVQMKGGLGSQSLRVRPEF